MARRTTTRRPKTDAELRSLGVPEDVIAYRRSKTRVWVGPLRGVQVDGERVLTFDEKLEQATDLRDVLRIKVEATRHRFRAA